MKSAVNEVLQRLRREKGLTQKALAERMTANGVPVGNKTIYNWERGLAQPNVDQFIALCRALGVQDIMWEFAGIHSGAYAGLNDSGRKKAKELIDLLFHIDMYRDDPEASGDEDNILRLLPLYEIAVSAGRGSYLDESPYEMIEVPGYVPKNADFALRVKGDSMEPLYLDGQVIWVREQPSLDSGEIGVFYYIDSSFCKKYIIGGDGAVTLRSLNAAYDDIFVDRREAFKVIGKIVS